MKLYLEDETQPTIIKEIIDQIEALDKVDGQLVQARARPAADPARPAVPDRRRPLSPQFFGHVWTERGVKATGFDVKTLVIPEMAKTSWQKVSDAAPPLLLPHSNLTPHALSGDLRLVRRRQDRRDQAVVDRGDGDAAAGQRHRPTPHLAPPPTPHPLLLSDGGA
jgi:hypothetical protein